MKKRIVVLGLVLAVLLLTGASATRITAQRQSEEIVALVGNAYGDSVLVTLVGGGTLWVDERGTDMAAAVTGRDVACPVSQVAVTTCGNYLYVATACEQADSQMFVFELRVAFPCAQPTTLYIPLVRRER